jgi:hypothetical protein
VYSKEWSRSSLSSLVKTSAALAALSAGVCSILIGTALRSISHTPIVMDSTLGWLSGLHVNIEKNIEADEVQVPAHFASIGLIKQLEKPVVKRKKLSRPKKKIEAAAVAAAVEVAPAYVPETIALATMETTVTVIPDLSLSTEDLVKNVDDDFQMREVHLALQKQFVAAVSIQKTVSTQVAIEDKKADKNPEPESTKELAVAVSQPEESTEQKVEPKLEPVVEPLVETKVEPTTEPVQLAANTSDVSEDSVVSESSAPDRFGAAIEDPVVPVMDTQKPEPIIQKDSLKIDTLSLPKSIHKGVSQITIPTKEQKENKAVTTQSRDIAPPSVQMSIQTPVTTQSVVAARQAVLSVSNTCNGGVEAFDWQTPLCADKVEVLAHDGPSKGRQMRWVRALADGHWPTLAWRLRDRDDSILPLISNNSALLLAKLAGGSPLEERAGIVFGKVPAGWKTEFSGRAESVIYLDADNKPTSDIASDRFFAYVNADPGMHLLTLVRNGELARVSIAVPVIESTSTFVDAGAPEVKTVFGSVYDGAAVKLKGVAKINVQIVGQPGRSGITQRDGSFKIESVWTSGKYPVFFEAVAKEGFTHRYKVSVEALSGVALFYFSGEQIGGWVGQLEGGVSAESGLIIGALPGLTGEGVLHPRIRPLYNASLSPEVYGIADNGQLTATGELSASASRFMAVQIPDGANIARVEDENRKPIWSELVISSPGVVNVLGPW